MLGLVIAGRVDERVVDRIVAETRGNPLALLGYSDFLDRGGPLMRIHPDHHCAHRSPPPHLASHLRDEGGHRYSGLRKPLLSLSLPRAAPGPRRPNESHTTQREQPK